MFARKLRVDCISAQDSSAPCPIKWLDSFAMRNFTNHAVFDDTLPVADGMLEVGYRVPLDKLQSALEDWLRRKSYLKPEEHLQIQQV